MFYDQIVNLEPEIDKMAQEIIASEKEVSNFIASIISQSKLEKNIDRLDNLLMLYRKWKVLYERLFDREYDLTMGSCEENIRTNYPLKEINDEQVDITVPRANRKTGIDDIIELIKEVDPYSSFRSSFKKNSTRQIDSIASFKTKVSSDIQTAVELFKKSDLYNSRKKILKAINLLEKRKKISNDILYLYSWAYHILGNIAYVQSRYSWAETLYGASLSIKRQINDLPPIVVIATKSKFIFSQSWRLSVPEWHNKLSDLKDELKRLKRVKKPDIEWFNNIFIDLNYQMARCKRLLGDIPSAMKVCKIALSHSLENDNQVGIVLIPG